MDFVRSYGTCLNVLLLVVSLACTFSIIYRKVHPFTIRYIFQDYAAGELPPVPPPPPLPPIPHNEDGVYHKSPSEDSGLGLAVSDRNNTR